MAFSLAPYRVGYWICLAIDLIFVFARLIIHTFVIPRRAIRVRGPTVPRPRASDWWLILHAACYITLTSLFHVQSTMVEDSMRKAPDLPAPYGLSPSDQTHFDYILFLLVYVLFCTLWTIKASLLATLYSALGNTHNEWLRRILHCITAFVICMFLTSVLAAVGVDCAVAVPGWTGPKCTAQGGAKGYLINTIVNVITDVLSDLPIMIFPIYLILSRVVPTSSRERYAIFLIVAFGSLSPVSSLVKFGILYHLLAEGNLPSGSLSSLLGVIAAIEIPIAVMAVCAPSLRVLVRSWIEGRSRGTQRSKGTSSKGTYGSSGIRSTINDTTAETAIDPDQGSEVELQPQKSIPEAN